MLLLIMPTDEAIDTESTMAPARIQYDLMLIGFLKNPSYFRTFPGSCLSPGPGSGPGPGPCSGPSPG